MTGEDWVLPYTTENLEKAVLSLIFVFYSLWNRLVRIDSPVLCIPPPQYTQEPDEESIESSVNLGR